MKSIRLRKAKLSDLDILLEFEQGVITYERHFDDTLAEDPISYYDVNQMIISDEIELLVAEYNGELVGSGYARIELPKPYLKHKLYSYLGFMYVKPNFRGNGIIGLIIDELKKWSISKGISEIRLDVYANNIAAIKAYEKSGFDAHLLNMRIK